MPLVVGTLYLDAEEYLSLYQLVVTSIPVVSPGSTFGYVLTQSIAENADISPGNTVTLTYAAEIEPRYLFVRHS